MSRVVSLIASATEIVAALGHARDLVGRSHECDWPPDVKRLPRVSKPLFPTDTSSKAIDLAVKDRLRRALSIYEVDAEQLKRLAPDVILTQTQCEVCAVTPHDVERAVCELAGQPVRVVALEPHRLGDVWEDIRLVAEALGDVDAGAVLVASLRARVLKIATRASTIAARPSVGVIEWIDPLMSAGNWMPELVEMAGGRNLFGESGVHSPWLEWERVVDANPDVLLVSPCGFGMPRSLEEIGLLEAKPGWSDLAAVRDGRVYVADGNAYFHRPGPRLVESLEILAELVHPETFRFGHEGEGWMSLPRA
jgi:iron complex transport system substrate-binding protein